MKWNNKYSGEWLKRFALLPENVNGETVWLAHFWERYVTVNSGKGCECGSHVIGKYERRIDNPTRDREAK